MVDMNKIVIIVLVLIAAVFFIFVGVGSFESEPEKDPKKVKAPPGSETLNNLFGGLQEKIVLRCDPASSANSSLQCQKLLMGTANIPPAKEPSLPFLKKTTFRTAKIVLLSGQATIFYRDNKGISGQDNPRITNLTNPNDKNSNVESIVVLERGGTLNISCIGNTSCQVGQQ